MIGVSLMSYSKDRNRLPDSDGFFWYDADDIKGRVKWATGTKLILATPVEVNWYSCKWHYLITTAIVSDGVVQGLDDAHFYGILSSPLKSDKTFEINH